MNLPGLSISRPVFTTMIMFAITLFGVVMYRGLSVDQFPEVDLPVVTVVTVYPGADPSTVEEQVTTPIEDALNTLAGIDDLTSASVSSVSQVVLRFKLGTDVDVAAQDMRDALELVELPDQVEDPLIQKVDLGAAPILQLAVTGSGDINDLVTYVEDELAPSIERIDGVGSVDLLGSSEREIHAWIDPGRLQATGLTIGEVAQALGGQNVDVPGGRIDNGEQELSLRAAARVDNPDDLSRIVLTSVQGTLIRLGDLATIEDGLEERRSSAFLDGEPAIALLVRKQSDGNTVDVADAVKEALPELRAAAPAGTRIVPVVDNSTSIRSSIETVQLDIILGGVLAVAIILLFLRDWRATLISATALPVSVIGTFAFVAAMGFTLNMMTTLALSLSIGILIDDAIVVIENIVRHRTAFCEGPAEAAERGTSEIVLAVLATTLSIVAVFVPVAFMDGMVGQFFFQFGLTVAFAVLMSLFVSFTLTPMLSSRFLAEHAHDAPATGVSGAIQRVLNRIENGYRSIIRWALRHRIATLGMAGLSLVLTAVLAGALNFEFVPAQDTAQFEVSIELPPDTSLGETERRALAMADRLQAMGGVTSTLTTVGGGVQEKANLATILVSLPHKSERGFGQQQAISVARETLASEPNALVSVGPLELTNAAGGNTADLQLELRGSDLETLADAAQQVASALAAREGFVDIDTSVRFGKPELEIRVDPDRAADLGVAGGSVAMTVRNLVAGVVPTQIETDGERHDVRLQLALTNRDTTDAAMRAQVRSASGRLVSVGDVASVNQVDGPSQIDHRGRERQVVVSANLDGISLGDASSEAVALAESIVPPGTRVALAGDSERLAETQAAMLGSMLLALALVYMILASQFESFLHPFTIMMSVPFAFVGAFGALVVTGESMSIFGMIGLIMLVGLVTKNAILLVDFAIQRLQAGDALHDALVEAGATRLMPILMTTAAMVGGMLPVALGHGDGGELRAAMGLAVIGGLLSSTVLTLVVVPVVFTLVEGLQAFLARLFHRSPSAHIDPEAVPAK